MPDHQRTPSQPFPDERFTAYSSKQSSVHLLLLLLRRESQFQEPPHIGKKECRYYMPGSLCGDDLPGVTGGRPLTLDLFLDTIPIVLPITSPKKNTSNSESSLTFYELSLRRSLLSVSRFRLPFLQVGENGQIHGEARWGDNWGLTHLSTGRRKHQH